VVSITLVVGEGVDEAEDVEGAEEVEVLEGEEEGEEEGGDGIEEPILLDLEKVSYPKTNLTKVHFRFRI
jgi:hypothetical protein